jgi:hypothetical protein
VKDPSFTSAGVRACRFFATRISEAPVSDLFDRLGSPHHFWCEMCGVTQPTDMRDLKGLDSTGRFLGGDIVCSVCGGIIATYGYPAERRQVPKEHPGRGGRLPYARKVGVA